MASRAVSQDYTFSVVHGRKGELTKPAVIFHLV
jgi:hypothetical protein